MSQTVWILLDSRGPGGIETHVGLLAAALARRGARPVLVFLQRHGSHPLEAVARSNAVPLRYLAGGFAALYRAMRRHRPALLHTHGYKAGILGRLAGLLSGTPVVSTFHAGEPGRGRLRLYTWLDRLTAPLSRPIAVDLARAAFPQCFL